MKLPWIQIIAKHIFSVNCMPGGWFIILKPLREPVYCANTQQTFHFLTRFIFTLFVYFWRDIPQWSMAFSFTRFLDHTRRRTTICRTPLNEWSTRCRDLYLTTHNKPNRQTTMSPVWFESTTSAGERRQTYALDLASTGTDFQIQMHVRKVFSCLIKNGRREYEMLLMRKLQSSGMSTV